MFPYRVAGMNHVLDRSFVGTPDLHLQPPFYAPCLAVGEHRFFYLIDSSGLRPTVLDLVVASRSRKGPRSNTSVQARAPVNKTALANNKQNSTYFRSIKWFIPVTPKASVLCLSPVTSSAQIFWTSELLRFL